MKKIDPKKRTVSLPSPVIKNSPRIIKMTHTYLLRLSPLHAVFLKNLVRLYKSPYEGEAGKNGFPLELQRELERAIKEEYDG